MPILNYVLLFSHRTWSKPNILENTNQNPGDKGKNFIEIVNFHQIMDLNHECNICGKSFTTSGALKLHIKTLHEGKHKYKCDSCGKFFTTSGNLTNHIKAIHDAKRNFKCDLCKNSFVT